MPKKESPHFVICLNNANYEASLEVGKVYRVIADEDATSHGYIRVVDESGEDYAFDANRFHKVEFPPTVEAALDSALR
ncbi:MAG: hypothetical protein QGG64_05950 [Candidatus Latescibacteria bacterium]|nr:hypothetical protein [Candidatus Latescibacterota bacterium]